MVNTWLVLDVDHLMGFNMTKITYFMSNYFTKENIVSIKGYPWAYNAVLNHKLLSLADKMRFCANWGSE